MAVVYGVLGLVVILTAGTFGTINSSPWFNLGIAILFVVLGLAMFDVLVIDFSSFSSGMANPTKRGSFAVAFTMGAVAALLAGACVAPVVIQVVLFSSSLYAGGTSVALALPFVLGVGMAIPWPIAGAGLASLPKPGKWMVRIKEAFGVLIIGTAALLRLSSVRLFADRWVDAAEVTRSVQEQLESGWTSSLAAGLDTAEREQEAGADRLLGDVVQELSDDGQDDAEGSGGRVRARQLRAREIPGRRSRRRAGPIDHVQIQCDRPAHIRDPETKNRRTDEHAVARDFSPATRAVRRARMAILMSAGRSRAVQVRTFLLSCRSCRTAGFGS